MSKRIAAAITVAVIAAGLGTAYAATGTSTATGIDGFTPVTQTRVFDSGRLAGDALLGSGKSQLIDPNAVTAGLVPAGATAVEVQITAASETASSGDLDVYPAGAAVPATSNLNYVKGVPITSDTVATLGTGGKFEVYNHGGGAGSVRLIVDILGYFAPTATYTPPQTAYSATTVISNWPESSGWATDNFNRTVTLTRGASVPASDCGSAASGCWFYTEVLADSGSFTAVAGKAAPNGSDNKTISSVVSGTMVGGGKLEFYADSSTPNPQLVPVTATGADNLSTTSWYKLFFAAGTNFGTAAEQVTGYGPWTTYAWNYASACQTWHDGINPGDDGQGAADGDITGPCAS